MLEFLQTRVPALYTVEKISIRSQIYKHEKLTNKVGGPVRQTAPPREPSTRPSTCPIERLDVAELSLYLLLYVLQGFVVDLQVISDSPILLQAARLQATERNGGGRSEVNQILEESCEKADSVSRSARSIECRWLIMQSFGWCGLHEEEKGFTVLANIVARRDVNWQ
jgi:hypothetical protein